MYSLLLLRALSAPALTEALETAHAVCLDVEGYRTIDTALSLIARLPEKRDRIFLKISPPGSWQGVADLKKLIAAPVRPGVLVLPHIRAAAELALVDAELNTARINDMTLHPVVERPAVANAPEKLLGAAARTSAVYFGGRDLARELKLRPKWERLAAQREKLLKAGAKYRLPVIDGPHFDSSLPLEEESRRSLHLGFAGKIAVTLPEATAILNTT
jgi:citrate lyase beta subunit